jgi:hypothetical protein
MAPLHRNAPDVVRRIEHPDHGLYGLHVLGEPGSLLLVL